MGWEEEQLRDVFNTPDGIFIIFTNILEIFFSSNGLFIQCGLRKMRVLPFYFLQ